MEMSCIDSGVILEWYKLRRAVFGVGEKPGVYAEEQLKVLYNSAFQSLEGFEDSSRIEQCRIMAHLFYDITTLDFEVQGMTKAKYHQLFLRCAGRKHPEVIPARIERQRLIDRAITLGIIRREWFDYNCYKKS